MSELDTPEAHDDGAGRSRGVSRVPGTTRKNQKTYAMTTPNMVGRDGVRARGMAVRDHDVWRSPS